MILVVRQWQPDKFSTIFIIAYGNDGGNVERYGGMSSPVAARDWLFWKELYPWLTNLFFSPHYIFKEIFGLFNGTDYRQWSALYHHLQRWTNLQANVLLFRYEKSWNLSHTNTSHVQFSVTNLCVALNDMCNISDSAPHVIRRASLTIVVAVLKLMSVSVVTGASGPSFFEVDYLLYTCFDDLPSWNILN